MSKYFMGVDPGATGAAAFINEAGAYLCCFDYPGSASALSNDITGFLGAGGDYAAIALAVIENVHTMPAQGVSSSGKFMRNFGIWEGVIAAKRIPYELITTQRWRKILDSSVPIKPDKEDLRQYVIRRWPETSEDLKRKKDHNRAEAILMAQYARMKYLGQVK